jgi:putative transcriptional regulator
MMHVLVDFAEPPYITPAAGRILLALPALMDGYFDGSVVYLLESDPEAGSAGVIVNVATRTPVGQVLPGWHDASSEPNVIFKGGPVQPDGALCLAKLAKPDAIMPTPGLRAVRTQTRATGVALVDLDGDVDEIRAAVTRLRVFAGHAGWSPGQLEDEIAERAWHVVPGRADHVFSEEPDTLWRRIAREQPNWISWLSTYPADPLLN